MARDPLNEFAAAAASMGAAAGRARDAMARLGTTMAEVNVPLRNAIRALLETAKRQNLSDACLEATLIPPPFRDIRVILTSGDAYDVNGNFLLTLAPDGIEDMFQRLNVVETRESIGGPAIRRKNRLIHVDISPIPPIDMRPW